MFNLCEEDIIGSGSFGTVYKAYSTRPGVGSAGGPPYAVKKLSLSGPDRIKKELNALHSVRHLSSSGSGGKVNNGAGSVIQLLACFISRDADKTTLSPSVCFVFPFFDATPWIEYVVDITQTELRAYVHHLLSALEFIHFCNILHRDIKPANVLFNRGSLQLVVVDFGLAERVDPKGFIEKDSTFFHGGGGGGAGTFGYRAPEILFKSAHSHQSTKIDVWSAGQIFLCLLTGRKYWFSHHGVTGADRNGNARTIAQLCSMFGPDSVKGCASNLGKKLECFFPRRSDGYAGQTALATGTFPSGSRIISSILDLRHTKTDRFDLSLWELVAQCWRLDPTKRATASQGLSVLLLQAEVRVPRRAPVNGDVGGNQNEIPAWAWDVNEEGCGKVIVTDKLYVRTNGPQLQQFGGVRESRDNTLQVVFNSFQGPLSWLFFYFQPGSQLLASPFHPYTTNVNATTGTTGSTISTQRTANVIQHSCGIPASPTVVPATRVWPKWAPAPPSIVPFFCEICDLKFKDESPSAHLRSLQHCQRFEIKVGVMIMAYLSVSRSSCVNILGDIHELTFSSLV
jgi:serine/threonine protein kinase